MVQSVSAAQTQALIFQLYPTGCYRSAAMLGMNNTTCFASAGRWPVGRVFGPRQQKLPQLDAYGVCTDNFPIIDTNSFIHERIHPRRTY